MPGSRFPRRGSPESFGWVRDPEKDCLPWRAWERPDGAPVWVHFEVGALVQFIPGLPPEPDLAVLRR